MKTYRTSLVIVLLLLLWPAETANYSVQFLGLDAQQDSSCSETTRGASESWRNFFYLSDAGRTRRTRRNVR